MISIKIDGNEIKDYLASHNKIPIVQRNRDWTPVFAGFNLSVMQDVPNIPEKGDTVIVNDGTSNLFLGVIVHVHTNDDENTYELEVQNYLQQLDAKTITYNHLHVVADGDFYITKTQDDFDNDGVAFTVSAADNIFTSTGHGLQDGDTVLLYNVLGLPLPLKDNIYYTVTALDGDTFYLHEDRKHYWFGIYFNNASTYAVDVTQDGAGKFLKPDKDLYNDWDYLSSGNGRYGVSNSLVDLISCLDIETKTDSENHGLSGGDWVIFNGDSIDSNLVKDRIYRVVSTSVTDTEFAVYSSHLNAQGDTVVELAGDSDDFYFSLAIRDDQQASPYGSHAYPTPTVNLKWLIENMFIICGMKIDFSNLTSTVINDEDDTAHTFADIMIDENMLYNVGHGTAADRVRNNGTIESNADAITFGDFIREVFGKYGIAIRFTGDTSTKTYTAYEQKRSASTGIIDPDGEDEFDLTADKKLNYSADLIEPDFDAGYKLQRRFINVRWLYRSIDEVDLEESDVAQAGVKGQDLVWSDNLRFFIKSSTEGQLLNFNSGGGGIGETDNEHYNNSLYSLLNNQYNAILNDISREEIECDISELSQDVWTQLEVSIKDIWKETIFIVQEQLSD